MGGNAADGEKTKKIRCCISFRGPYQRFISPLDIPTEESINLWRFADAELKGAARRKFRAQVVRSLEYPLILKPS